MEKKQSTILWFTGLSGAGKTTLTTHLKASLDQLSIPSIILDGDQLRAGLCSDLSFSPEDRSENIRRTYEVAKILAQAGIIVLCALISPYRKDRNQIREKCSKDGIDFAEIYINAPLEVCEDRDPRGLYKKAHTGKITNFTGIAAPYEPPENPELEIRTHEESVEASLSKLQNYIKNSAPFCRK